MTILVYHPTLLPIRIETHALSKLSPEDTKIRFFFFNIVRPVDSFTRLVINTILNQSFQIIQQTLNLMRHRYLILIQQTLQSIILELSNHKLNIYKENIMILINQILFQPINPIQDHIQQIILLLILFICLLQLLIQTINLISQLPILFGYLFASRVVLVL